MLDGDKKIYPRGKVVESIIETANAIMLTWEKDTTITSFNTYAKKILGYTDKDVIGTKWLEFIPPDIKKYMKGVSEKIVSEEDLYWDHENPWLCKDGSIKFILWRNSPIKDEHGNTVSYISIGVDMTERKKAEEALKETEKKFRTLFEGANDSIFIHDLAGNFVEANETATQRLGYSKNELKKMKVSDIEPPEYKESIPKRIHKISENKSLFSETLHITKDGENIPVELSSRIIELNNRPFILCIARDITDRKRAEEEMKKQLMKFRLEGGEMYSVREIVPTVSIEAFKDLQKVGYDSLIISRNTEKEFRNRYSSDYKYIWLHDKHNRSESELSKIEKYIGELNRKTVILLDRIDYLILKYGFDKTLNFINSLKDLAYFNGLIILLTLDYQLLTDRELKYIEKDTKKIELRHGEALSDDLLEILKYVYSMNKKGLKPSFSDVGNKLSITRPTIKKRIDSLMISDYVNISTNGPCKVVELTQKGKDLFF